MLERHLLGLIELLVLEQHLLELIVVEDLVGLELELRHLPVLEQDLLHFKLEVIQQPIIQAI